MLNRLPKRTPELPDLMHAIGNLNVSQVAKAMDVHVRTVHRWLEKGNTPRPVLLALFWITHWGQQWVDTDLFNMYRNHSAMNDALKRALEEQKAENRALRTQIEKLGQLGDFGSANDPTTGASGPGPTAPDRLTFWAFEADQVEASQPERAKPVDGRASRKAAPLKPKQSRSHA